MALALTDFDSIIDAMIKGSPLKRALIDHKRSPTEFFNAINQNPGWFEVYERAQQSRAELYADEIIEISDTEEDHMRARNRIDARKWYASKMQPKKFGDRIDLNVTQTVDIGGALAEAKSRALRIRDVGNNLITQSVVTIGDNGQTLTDSESDGAESRDAHQEFSHDIFS